MKIKYIKKMMEEIRTKCVNDEGSGGLNDGKRR